ncbi:MAG TPA: GntR family transcriptional regulator [Dermatophilaceae bacterium]|nr:GntR family transcriptional regulator [Dermatophilaceae bacterium]
MSAPLGIDAVDRTDSLRVQVAERLRGLLVAGRLVPGQVYSAPALAAEFGVSATPVREAMLDLAGQGLVEPVRNKGFRVTQVSEHELDSLAELRALIEIPVMAQLARECVGDTAQIVEGLRPLADELVATAEAGDLAAYITLDTRFHLALLALHGNPYVVDVVRDLRARSRLYGLQQLAERGTLRQNATEHLAILDAAIARDPDAMTRVMQTHIGHLRRLWAGRAETD